MLDGPSLPLPSSLEEVEALIVALYEPGPPDSIARIQEVLHRVQKSPQGWQIAQSLLGRPTDTVKFFGALTVIVKLNTESSSLSSDDSRELLQNLIGWFVRSLRDGSGPMVTKKLCSALVTCYIHFAQLWPACIKHLLCCLHSDQSLPVTEFSARGEVQDVASVVERLEFAQLRAALWFAATLVEETGKTDMNSAKYISAHNQLIIEGVDVAVLINRGLNPGFRTPECIKTQEDAIKCLQPWIMYNQRISSSTDALTNPLRTLIGPVINCLVIDELYEASIELLADTLANYSGFFTGDGYDVLYSLFETDWARKRYQQLVDGDFDFDSVQFGMLMIAFGDARVVKLQQGVDDRSRRILGGLSGLLAASGYAVGEDKVFVPALEFWATFVETMVDSVFSGDEDDEGGEGGMGPSKGLSGWKQAAMALIMQVVGSCFKKIQYPSSTVFASWDSSERAGFGEARKDVADLLQTVYTISGPSLISVFVDLLLQALPTQSWAELEASAFCLGALADCVPEGGSCDDLLSKVFSSGLFDLLGQTDRLPVRLRQTGLSLIERFSDYFERHGEFLPGALNLLFGAVGDAFLSGPSSKSICTLCSSCRSLLTGEVATFITSYEAIHASATVDTLAEEKIVTAISSVVQAISDADARLQAFSHLFSLIRRDVDHCIQLKLHPEQFERSDPFVARYCAEAQSQSGSQSKEPLSVDKVAAQIALQSARYLVSMAKGMQAATEVALVELEGPQSSKPTIVAGWEQRLRELQSEIVAMLIQLQASFPEDGQIVETICQIFRAGFSETESGPFVFRPEVVTDFITRQSVSSTPQIGYVVGTTCAFASSLANGPPDQAVTQLSTLLPWAVGLLQSLQEPESDTELSQNVIELGLRVLQKQPGMLMHLQPTSQLEYFFMFTIKVLDGRETLVKNVSADFWTAFISLRVEENASLQESVSNVMEHLGPLISQSLVRNIGGNAARSELDRLSEPLKKLVVQHVKARSWLEGALTDPSFPSSNVTAGDKSVFLKKILSLRGSRQTNLVVREFWLACRGSNFAYAS